MVRMTNSQNQASFIDSYLPFEDVFDITNYPAGERHVRVRDDVNPACVSTIEATVRNFDDLAMVVTADRILRRIGCRVEWFIPYFPFARHDRRIDSNDGFELELALEMIREVDLLVADPHSEMTAQLRHFSQADVVDRFVAAGLFDDGPVVVIPDAGAAKKTYSWLKGRSVVQALKQRDVRTGALSGFEVLTDDLKGRPCIIVDDICDGGGTFLGLASELRKANAGSLTLAVTHGLFTKGVDQLLDVFDTVACLTPTGDEPVAGVRAIPFNDLYSKGAIT